MKAPCASSAFVDSALPGSHDFASFFSTPLSFPASGPAAAARSTQNRTTTYFIRRPVMNVMTLVMNASDRRVGHEPPRQWMHVLLDPRRAQPPSTPSPLPAGVRRGET